MRPRWIVYGASHPAFHSEIVGRYRFWLFAQLAAWHFQFWTCHDDPWARAWVGRDWNAPLPPARVHR